MSKSPAAQRIVFHDPTRARGYSDINIPIDDLTEVNTGFFSRIISVLLKFHEYEYRSAFNINSLNSLHLLTDRGQGISTRQLFDNRCG